MNTDVIVDRNVLLGHRFLMFNVTLSALFSSPEQRGLPVFQPFQQIVPVDWFTRRGLPSQFDRRYESSVKKTSSHPCSRHGEEQNN